MLSKPINNAQLNFLQPGLYEQLCSIHPLYILAGKINWPLFEKAFAGHYSTEGRPAKPIRLMVALLILKHVRSLSDESVVEQWAENAYYQYFSGQGQFTCAAPCEATDLGHFRNRVGAEGVELILQESIRVNGKDGQEKEAVTDTTVQERTSPILPITNCTVRSLKNVYPWQKSRVSYYAKAISVP